MSIKQLPQNLINQIAAGEVIERPASVVKELVENSIDAGASEINIKIRNAGISEIVIEDNGSGIQESDLDLLFARHSTSKISNLDDLFSIHTLGFRGEALSSISSISKVRLETSTDDSGVGYLVEFDTENKMLKKRTRSNKGSRFTIFDLFYNVPARRKFLKSENTEKTHIIDTFLNIAIVNSDVSFKLIIDDREIYSLKNEHNLDSEGTLRNRIKQIFQINDKDFLDINSNINGIHISGLVAHPNIVDARKDREFLFVNHRYIKDQIIRKAIIDSYKGFIPHQYYPRYFLNITVDPKIVDVNVHPRKLEVRWDDGQIIYKAIYHALRDKLEKVLKLQVNSQLNDVVNDSFRDNTELDKLVAKEHNANTVRFNTFKSENRKQYDFPNSRNQNSYMDLRSSDEYSDNKFSSISGDTKLNYTQAMQILFTYIILEYSDKILIIDQHAAAERVTFDKLKKIYESENHVNSKNLNQVEDLLLPIEFVLEPKYVETYLTNKNFFENLGFNDNLIGNMLTIKSIPTIFKRSNIEQLILETLSEMIENELGENRIDSKIDRILATMACHNSVRGIMRLDKLETDNLVSELFHTLNPYSCPHGRPIIWELTKGELEKRFGRIM